MTELQAYILAKKYVEDILDGVELIQGKDCKIQSIEEIDGGNKVTFAYYDDAEEGDTDVDEDGKVLKTISMNVMDGEDGNGISNIAKTSTSGKTDTYTITFTDGTTKTFTVKNADEMVVSEEANTQFNYQVGFKVGDGDKTVTPNLKGTFIFEGTEIVSTDEVGTTVIIENSKKYDLYLNTETKNLYQRTDYNPITETTANNHWQIIATLRGADGLNAYRTWLTIEGNEGKTIQQWVQETSGSAYEIQKVFDKPNIQSESTELNVWYFYKMGKPLPKTKWVQRLFTTSVDTPITIASGDKITLKCVENETTTWVAITVPTLPELLDGEGYVCQITLNHTDGVIISKYNIASGIYSAYFPTIVMSDNVSIISAQDGYTETVTNEIVMADDAWKYISTPIEIDLPQGHYAFWNGTQYLLFDINFPTTHSEDVDAIIMWDEKNGIGMMWGYHADEDKYYLAFPSFTQITQSSVIPSGYTDLSEEGTLTQMGTWNQTMYVRPSSEAVISEVTITMGESYAGLITQLAFDQVIGTTELHTEATTVKEAINELNDIIRTGTDASLDTDVKNIIGAINELESKKLDKKFSASDEDKFLKVVKDASGVEVVYEARPVEMTGLLDLIYPIGSICFGQHPTIGTWEAYNFGGYVCADTSLANGTTMIEHLPNITGAITGNSRNLLYNSGQATGAFAYVGASGKWHEQSGNSGGGNFNFDASRSSDVYGSANNHYNVEVKGKNVTAWIRTA